MNHVGKALETLALRNKAGAFEAIADTATNHTSQNYWYSLANDYMHQSFDLLRKHFPGTSIRELRDQLAKEGI